MKTVSVSEIIRTAQMGDTLYVLLTEAETEIAAMRERQRVLVEALENLLEQFEPLECYGLHSIKRQRMVEARAALATKEG